jgi:hypothetical protein
LDNGTNCNSCENLFKKADEKDKKAIKAYQDQTRFYVALERGAIEDIKYIREYLTKDHRK